MVEVFAAKVNLQKNNEEIDRMMSAVPVWRQTEARKFKKIEDKVRCLASYLLAAKVIADKTGCRRSDIKVERGEFGKLELLYPSGCFFNISHSGESVVCAIDNESVGIDVERIKPIDLNIAKRFFDKDEFKYIMRQPEKLRLDAFYETWTFKESYIKATGFGLHKPLSSFCIARGGGHVSVKDSEPQKCDWILKRLDFDKDYVLSVTGTNEIKDVVFTDEKELN